MATKKYKLIALIVALCALSFACLLPGLDQSDATISVEKIHPSWGDVYQEGNAIDFEVSVFASRGISKVDIEVNDQIIWTLKPNGQPQSQLIRFSWTPVDVGEMIMIIYVEDSEGTLMDSGPSKFQVVETLDAPSDASN